MKNYLLPTLVAFSASQMPALAQTVTITQLDSYSGPNPSSEIVVHDPFNPFLYNTYGSIGNGGVEIIDYSNPSSLVQDGLIPMNTIAGLNLRSVSSVAADPLGRGFGVATFIPEGAGSNPGRLVFFNPATKAVIHSVEVGYHPDSVRFSADGRQVFVANEGEPISEGANHFDRPGSISVIDLSAVNSLADVPSVVSSAPIDFSAGNLAAGLSLDALRVHPSNNNAAGRINDAEPEYIAQAGSKLYVTLQENNAVAEFDLVQGKWTAINPLGTIQQTIDASANDGGIQINDLVHGLPMPDAIATTSAGGRNFYITANEGDSRPADNVGAGHPGIQSDEARFQQLGAGGRPALDSDTDAALDALYGGNAQADSALGRLRISLIDGNLDADSAIEQPTMFGTRSFTIWDAATGDLVFDSGSDFETITGDRIPGLYNSNEGGPADARSQNKGPEPEGLALGEIDGRKFAFIGLERTGGIMMYDITDPENPFFVDYINTFEFNPEGLNFVPGAESPTGQPLLLVGYEVSNKVGVYSFHIPDAGSVLPAASLALAGLALARRRAKT